MCPLGTFSTLTNASCTPWTDCPPGDYVSAAGTPSSDRACAPCLAGQTSTQVNSPACVAISVAELVAGGNHTCALFSDGTVKCWGENAHGQLGYGNTQDVSDPASVGSVSVTDTPGVAVTQLWAGYEDTCALLSDQTLKCWGRSNWGQLGYGNTDDIGDDELPSSVGPISVTTTPGVTVTQIAAHYMHTCALLSDRSVACWGLAAYGQLGYGNTNNIGDDELPSSAGSVSVTSTPGARVTQIGAGLEHSCALLANGAVQCWGNNYGEGQLGYGSMTDIGDDETPSSIGPVSITTDPAVTTIGLTVGALHTCVLLSDASVRCWGYNRQGQLGNGNTQTIGDDELPSSVGAVSITTTPGVTVAMLATGGYHSCVLLFEPHRPVLGLERIRPARLRQPRNDRR